jgi:hypothetical protein
MNTDMVADLIRQSKGQFFTVWFRKLDGSMRKLNGRIGVHKYLIKDLNPTVQKERDLERITVYDVKNKGYRSFYIGNVLKIKIRKFNLTDYSVFHATNY